jgi:branched-chain amino acid transport system permease protein
MLWFGLAFVALVLFKPEGIAGIFASTSARERKPDVPAIAAQSEAR